MARVELQNVTKIYPGNVLAVNRVNLVIADQEFVVLVGPSGCGKSTTLRMVAGLEEISAGTISIAGRVVNDVAPKDRNIAMVFQNYALYPHMTVYNNMAFALMLRRRPRKEIREKVLETAKVLGIEHLLERKPKELSGGQRQRVAVGRAIVREPAAFLFDEPLSNLDAKLRVTTRAELKRLHQRLRTTTIYVTHDQEEAMTLGDRIVVMKDGLIQQASSPLETYNQPSNRFVAGFIGMPPMNFFDGSIVSQGGQFFFEEGTLAEARAMGRSDEPKVAVGRLQLPGTGFRLSLPSQLAQKLQGQVGQHVVLGVRPEHLRVDCVAGEANVVDMAVHVVEPLGNDMDLYMSTALNEHVIARVEAHAGLKAGLKLPVRVDLARAHFFAPGETGMNLTAANGSAHAAA